MKTRQPPEAAALLRAIGHRVGYARRSAELTQEELAGVAGVSRFTVMRIETGKAVESWALALVLEALKMHVALPRELDERP